MNKMELTREFNTIKDISETIIRSEYIISEFRPEDKNFKSAVEKLKFKCLKYELYEIDEIDRLSRLNKKQLLEFCGELKQYVFSEFVENLPGNIIEMDKYFRDFYEVYKAIILMETVVGLYSTLAFLWELQIDQLKYVCLKHKLCEFDELENLSEIEDPETMLKFCEEIKEIISNEFLEKILNK